MPLETILLLIIGFSALAYPLFRYIQNKKSLINKYLLLVSISGAAWTFSIAAFRVVTNIKWAYIWTYGIYFSGTMIGLWVFLLFHEFYTIKSSPDFNKRKADLEKVLAIIFAFILIFIRFLPGFISKINMSSFPNTAILGYPYLIWSILFIAYLLYPAIKVIKNYKYFNPIKKSKGLYLLLGFMIAAFISVIFDVILPWFKDYKDIWIGPITIIILNMFWAYSLSRTHYLSRLTIKKTIIESFSYAVYFIISILLFIYLKNLAEPHTNKTLIILILILILLNSFALPAFITFIQRKIIPKIIKDVNKYQQIKNKFAHNTYNYLNLTDLTKFLALTLQKDFNLKWTYIIQFKITKTGNIKLLLTFSNSAGKNITKDKIKNLIYQLSYLEENIILQDELELSIPEYLEEQLNKELQNKVALWQFIKKHKIPGLIKIPLRDNNGILIIMGERHPYVFNSEEIELLKYIQKTLRLSYSRSLLYQQILNFNKDLQKEVEKATTKLRKRLEQIQELRRKERDMLDIMGHELRTPLSIIKMTLELLNMKLDSNSFTVDDYKKYSERMTEALQREIILLERMLSSAKLDANKMKINKEKVDLKKIIDDSLLAFRKQAEEKELRLTSNVNKFKQLYITGDATRAPEIIDNLVSNAIKYTEKGGVTIRINEERDFIKVDIIDTGIGIPKDKIKLLGQKFYRVNQYIDDNAYNIVRPGGTGLGLYVTFNLIKLMGGKYKVTSKVGKGSTFTVYFKKWKS